MAATLRSAVAAAPAAVTSRRSVAANAASRPLWAPGKGQRSSLRRCSGGKQGGCFFSLPQLTFCLCRLPLFVFPSLTLNLSLFLPPALHYPHIHHHHHHPLQESRPRPTSTEPSPETAASTPSASAPTPRRSLGKVFFFDFFSPAFWEARASYMSLPLSPFAPWIASPWSRYAKGAAGIWREGGKKRMERVRRGFRSAAAKEEPKKPKGSPFISFLCFFRFSQILPEFPLSKTKKQAPPGRARPLPLGHARRRRRAGPGGENLGVSLKKRERREFTESEREAPSDRRSPLLRPRNKKKKIQKQPIKPDVWFYDAALPENLPKSAFFGGPTGEVNLGGVLAWEVRRMKLFFLPPVDLFLARRFSLSLSTHPFSKP